MTRYDALIENLYISISDRVKEKMKEKNLEPKHIYPKQPTTIQHIIENNRKNKNNKYLIPDYALYTTNGDEEYGLTVKLKMTKKEIIWGTDEEIENYIQDLCIELFYIIDELNLFYDKEKKEPVLLDPLLTRNIFYAIRIAYNSFDKKYDEFFKNFFLNLTDEMRFIYTKEHSILVLYECCKNDFRKIYMEYIKTADTLSKIDKHFLNDFIIELFIPMLKKYAPIGYEDNFIIMKLVKNNLEYLKNIEKRYPKTLFDTIANARTQSIFEYMNMLIGCEAIETKYNNN